MIIHLFFIASFKFLLKEKRLAVRVIIYQFTISCKNKDSEEELFICKYFIISRFSLYLPL